MYARVMALIGHVLDNWLEFDGYCATRGIDPLSLPSRRFISVAWYWMIEGREQKHIDELIHAFYSLEGSANYAKAKKAERRLKAVPNEQEQEDNKKVVLEPGKKWRAPEGWTPPDWNEYKSMQEAKKFMGFQANPRPKKKK